MDEAPGRRYYARAATHEGRVRDHNEDSILVTEVANVNGVYHLWAVADGMGGGARGEDASRIAIETLEATLATPDWHNPKDALRQAFLDANNAVFCKGTGGGEATRSLMGTTLVAALVEEATGRFWVANVGDSRAYRIKDGRAQQITADHSLVAERVRAGLMTEADARHSSERNVITRAIGLEGVTTVDLFDGGQLEGGEVLLLCSDGLHGMVDDTRLAHLASTLDAETAASELVDAANEAGGTDNISVVVGGSGNTGRRDQTTARNGRGRRRPVVVAGSLALCLTAVALLLAFRGRDVVGYVRAYSATATATATPTIPPSPTLGPTSSPTPEPTPSPTPNPTPSPTPWVVGTWLRPPECPESVSITDPTDSLASTIDTCIKALQPTFNGARTDYCKEVAALNPDVKSEGNTQDPLYACSDYVPDKAIKQPSDAFLQRLQVKRTE